MSKESVLKALEKHSEKEAKKASKQMNNGSRSNKKPEKEVVKKLLNWCRTNGLYVHEIEAKGVYNERVGHYLHGQVAPGYPDISGNTSFGCAVFIEAKAKDRRSTLKPHQREFLEEKIKQHCFAICADSVDKLKFFFVTWQELYRQARYKEAQEFLLNMLPKKRKKRSKKEAEVPDDLPF